MNLDDIRNGTRIFVDANILLYALRGNSPQCRGFLSRCDTGAVEGWITTSIVAEFSHRRMIQEAQSLGLVGSNPARALSEKPALLRGLNRYAEEVRDLLGGGFNIESLRPDDFHLALEFQQRFGLLTNDSLNLAVGRRLGLTDVASADRGFDAAQGFMIYKPSDVVVP
jgi:predicted nucleic acid-binding protein